MYALGKMGRNGIDEFGGRDLWVRDHDLADRVVLSGTRRCAARTTVERRRVVANERGRPAEPIVVLEAEADLTKRRRQVMLKCPHDLLIEHQPLFNLSARDVDAMPAVGANEVVELGTGASRSLDTTKSTAAGDGGDHDASVRERVDRPYRAGLRHMIWSEQRAVKIGCYQSDCHSAQSGIAAR